MYCRTFAHTLDHICHPGACNMLVAGNHKTFRSTNAVCENNHEEADTLLIHCLTFCVNTRSVLIFATDTDIAVLLIVHRHHFPYQNIYFGVKENVVDIDVLYAFLGRERAPCLLSFSQSYWL